MLLNLPPATRRALEDAERAIVAAELAGPGYPEFLKYADDPVGFCVDVFGDDLWSKQIEVCKAVAESSITVVPAGRAVGKSFLLSRLVLWFLYTRPNSLVITTGPDHRQVVTVLWSELKRALKPRFIEGVQVSPKRELPYDFLTVGSGSPQRLVIEDGTKYGAIGFACKSDEGLSGQHAENLMMIIDEASGVADHIWESIFGAAASKYVIVGNPIKYSCRFRELFDAVPSSPDMRAVSISSLDHPHAALERSPIGAVSAAWLRQMGELQGVGSSWWRSNVLGMFPGQESVRFIPAAWLDACTDEAILSDEEWLDAPDSPIWMGVDIGGGVGADKSTVVVVSPKRLLEVFASDQHGVLDEATHRLEPIVVGLAKKWNVPPDHISYDRNGLGRSFGSYLANHGIDGAIGYYGGGRGGKYYLNRRTANAFAVKRRLDPKRKGFIPFYAGGIPEWVTLRQELAALQEPEMAIDEGTVKQMLESKDKLMARLKRSPDVMDAFLQCFSYAE